MFGVGAGALAMILMGQVGSHVQAEPAHARNRLFQGAIADGLTAGGATVKLPAPRLAEGQTAEAQRAALREVAGSDQRLEEMVRPSVTAPHVLRVRDVDAGDATIRVVDLWFVVHADLREVDPAKEAAKADGKEAEAGNMAFRTTLVKGEPLRARKIPEPVESGNPETWYAHIHGRLLDRIEFDVTNRVEATRGEGSIVVASRTAPEFDGPGDLANAWKPVGRSGSGDPPGSAPRPYAGGISYAKVSRLAFRPGALLVEMHGAFVEPREWFNGAPILRSKFGVVAQDQVRRLRRELERKRPS